MVDEIPAKADANGASALCAARAALGASYLMSASLGSISRRAGRGSRARAIVKILGARHLVQAMITSGRPSGAVLTLGAGVDAAHAASMAILGMLSGRWRGVAFTDALIAASLATAGLACAWRATPARVDSRGAADCE